MVINDAMRYVKVSYKLTAFDICSVTLRVMTNIHAGKIFEHTLKSGGIEIGYFCFTSYFGYTITIYFC